jgi:acyl-CoA hydrolase
MPSSVDELASRIVDDAVASGVMDATLGTALHVAQGGGHPPQGGEPPPQGGEPPPQGELPPGHEPSEGAPPPPDDPSRPPDSDEHTDRPRETSKPPAANETDLAGVAAAAHAAATGLSRANLTRADVRGGDLALVERIAPVHVGVAVGVGAHVARRGESGLQIGLQVGDGDERGALDRDAGRGGVVHVRVRVDQAGHHRGLAQIDDAGTRQDSHLSVRTHFGNPLARAPR